MSDHRQRTPEAPDAALEKLLKDELPTTPLTSEALERVRRAVAEAGSATYRPLAVDGDRRSPLRWGRWVGVAAAASLVAVAVTFFTAEQVGQREMIGSLARASTGSFERAEGPFWRHPLALGEPLRVGDKLKARGAALIVLAEGGTLRIGADTTLRVEATAQLALESGRIYVDKPSGAATPNSLRVATRQGLVEHLGTEFEVVGDDRIVRIRVREGQVRFSGATGVLVVPAGMELRASVGGQVTQRPVPTFGREWQWTAELAPEFSVEGRSLDDYLQWISRELGRAVVFADAEARDSARSTILHGSVRSPATLDALAEVLSSTSLTYELADGTIRVHSSR